MNSLPNWSAKKEKRRESVKRITRQTSRVSLTKRGRFFANRTNLGEGLNFIKATETKIFPFFLATKTFFGKNHIQDTHSLSLTQVLKYKHEDS